ncbi:endonuclease III [Patescibacteria group bacterium]|nr:endonuclease III [Patescibacteria group bacterium]MBU1721338.1 endonuclease III [Patescibacteria group bacterium]MBU1901623.1 endonuclease III [Patescibacteria group bacterium]
MTKKQRAELVLKELKKLYPDTQQFIHADTPWEFLVAVILTAQTTDKKVNEITPTLFARYKGVKAYANADIAEFESYIAQIGLYKSKAKYIIHTANMIHKTFNDTVPKTMEELITLSGVGRKTANVILSEVYGIQEGIIVDTHVIRLANKFKLASGNDAKKIEQALLPIIPKEERHYFSNALIAYGREHSPARKKDDDNDIISQALLSS